MFSYIALLAFCMFSLTITQSTWALLKLYTFSYLVPRSWKRSPLCFTKNWIWYYIPPVYLPRGYNDCVYIYSFVTWLLHYTNFKFFGASFYLWVVIGANTSTMSYSATYTLDVCFYIFGVQLIEEVDSYICDL